MFLGEFFEISESRFVGLWAQGGAVCLWPTSGIWTRNTELDCLDHGRRRGIPDHVPDKQQGHGDTGQRYNVDVTQEGVWWSVWGLSVVELIGHPVPIEEVESVVISTLRGASFYTLSIFDWDEDGAISRGIEWGRDVIFECFIEVSFLKFDHTCKWSWNIKNTAVVFGCQITLALIAWFGGQWPRSRSHFWQTLP